MTSRDRRPHTRRAITSAFRDALFLLLLRMGAGQDMWVCVSREWRAMTEHGFPVYGQGGSEVLDLLKRFREYYDLPEVPDWS